MKKSILIPYDEYIALKSINSPTTSTNEIREEIPVSQSEDRLSEDIILSLLPNKSKRKAQALLSFVQTTPSLSWNKQGEICINSHAVKNSHICDIIHYATTNKQTTPIGFLDFIKHLKNIPVSIISNPNAKALIGGQASVPPGIPNEFRDLSSWKLNWKKL